MAEEWAIYDDKFLVEGKDGSMREEGREGGGGGGRRIENILIRSVNRKCR